MNAFTENPIARRKSRMSELRLRFISLILVIATLLGVCPFSFTSSGDAEITDGGTAGGDIPVISVLHNSAVKKSITLQKDGKETLTSVISGSDSTNRSWQILNPDNNDWVDIFARTQESLDISYALVGSMLNGEGKAYVRCALKDGEELFVSEAVEIVMAYIAGEEASSESADPEDTETVDSPEASAEAATPSVISEDEYGTHTIIINYIFDNGGLAFEPYGASVAAASPFKASIPSPTVVGYSPVRRVVNEQTGEAVYIDATTVELDYASVDSDITINVIYEPAIVEFKVHHHLQNLLDDDYSLTYDYITTGHALTGSVVGDGLALSSEQLPGFSPLSYEKLTVAADGSTVIEIRYDRNYYLVNFDMDGGYGTEPVYTRYGSSVGANKPTRHGYLFGGWELVSYNGSTPTAEQKSLYDINSAVITLPDANLSYKASWITQVTTYTLVFWRENANDNNFTYWASLEDSAMSGTYVSGSDRISEVSEVTDEAYFTYYDARTDKDVLVEGDGSTVVNVYYTRNRYAITIIAPGVCVLPEDHTHTEDCYLYFCKASHVHGDECDPELSCTVPEHTQHTDECTVCGQTEHTHSSACCGLAEHTHSKDCWNNIGNSANPSGAPTRNEDGYIYRPSRSNTYYIYIKGDWYRYTGRNVSSGDVVNSACGSTEHTHGSSDCSCSLTEHSHTDSCYKDVLHTHGTSCYTYSCGLSEHVHSADCQLLNCGLPTGHSHSSTCTRASSNSTVKIVYAKYLQSLRDIWPITDGNGVTYDEGQRWTPSGSSLYDQVLVYIDVMPGDDFTLTLSTSDYDTYVMNYYLEALPTDTDTVTYDGVEYKLYTTVSANYNYITKIEDFFNITGFVQHTSTPSFGSGSNPQIDINGGGTVNMYYLRNRVNCLSFSSMGTELTHKSVSSIPFGHSLKEYYFVPDYPHNLEPGAFFFDGWYTSPGCFDGTEVDWDSITMDSGNMMFYAKWSPVVHSVKVFLTDSLDQQIGSTQNVNHGEFALAPTDTVSNGNYIFQGWFYKDTVDGETVEKAFVFNGIPVLDDLDIYAKWSSHVSVSYTINYVLFGTETKIAETITGSAIAGHNKTFYAKAGEELFDGYKTGYYPLTNSHTVTMSAESDHEYTFEYVYVESMPYLVRYVNSATGETVAQSKRVADNTYSVVTETFVKINKMMPDAYQKRLILSASGEDADSDGILDNNVITFYYTEDEIHAYYRVVHYVENIFSDGYREYRSEEMVGIIGNSYTVSALTLAGFSFNGALTAVNGIVTPVSSGSVTANLSDTGLLIELYYDRVEVSYTVNYLENLTNKVLYTQKLGQGIFGEQIVEYAPDLTLSGYSLVSDDMKVLSLSTSADLNVINFYYQESTYSIKYEIVGDDGSGALSQYSENLLSISGVPNGSYPIVDSAYHFAGWYLDASCTSPVSTDWVDPQTNRLVPENDGLWLGNRTYYAKIDPNHTTLTINTANCSASDADQIFVFNVKGTSQTCSDINLTVTVKGNGSVTLSQLPIGTYIVTELDDWSFRYTPDSSSKSITLVSKAENNTLTFSHIREVTKWLDGNSDAVNLFD